MSTLMTMVMGLERTKMIYGKGCYYTDMERIEGWSLLGESNWERRWRGNMHECINIRRWRGNVAWYAFHTTHSIRRCSQTQVEIAKVLYSFKTEE